MKQKVFATIISILFFAACATTNAPSFKPDPVLRISPEVWAKNIAAPYIMKNLADNSYVSGRNFIITKMDRKGNILFEIDEQTEKVREAIKSELLKVHGTRLISRAPVQDIHSQYSLNLLYCANYSFPEIVIGLIPDYEGNTMTYSINARLLNSNSFIGGFSQTASFNVTSSIRKSINSNHGDVEIKGILRDNPFNGSDADFISESFAYHTACSIHNAGLFRKDGQAIKVFIPQTNSAITNKVGLLIKHYLSLGKELSVTENKDNADVIAKIELVNITDNLYQIWLKPVKKNGEVVGGLGYFSYITLHQRLTKNCIKRPFLTAYSYTIIPEDYNCLDVTENIGRMSEIYFENKEDKEVYIGKLAEKPIYVFYPKTTSPPVVKMNGAMTGIHLIAN